MLMCVAEQKDEVEEGETMPCCGLKSHLSIKMALITAVKSE